MKVAKAAHRASATTSVSPSDYYYRFRQFCSFYPLRERHLADSILHAIGKLPDSKSSSFSILDVGSADGELLAELVGLLRARSDIELHCVAVEPDPVAFARLEVTSALLRKQARVIIDCIQGTIQDVITRKHAIPLVTFDCILCSHVFYHLKDWLGVIATFTSLLNREGCVVVILDSFKSPIYQFRESLEITLGNHGAIQDYGDLISAEDFLAFLKSSGLSYSHRELDWNLAFTQDHLIADLEGVLTFLYRFGVNGRKNVKRAVQKFAKKFSSGQVYVFPWKEALFVVTPHGVSCR